MLYSYLEIGNTLANLLDLSSALKAKDEGCLRRGVNSTLTHNQVLEVQATATKKIFFRHF